MHHKNKHLTLLLASFQSSLIVTFIIFIHINLTSSMAPSSYTRPGVEAAVRLSKLLDNKYKSVWNSIEAKYSDLLLAKKKGKNELLHLDEACEEIGQKWNSKITHDDNNLDCDVFMTCQDLYTIMKWKFAKGKSRPLWKYIHSNSEETVQECSKNAFTALMKNNDDSSSEESIYTAINELSILKGIGPAGASAILSLFKPELFVFMDDEVIECLYEDKREYTLKVYLDINHKCKNIALRLGEDWTPRKVGRALWSAAIASAYTNETDLTLEESILSESNSCSNDQFETNKQAAKRRRVS